MVYKRITSLFTKNNVIAIDKLKFLCYNVDISNRELSYQRKRVTQ